MQFREEKQANKLALALTHDKHMENPAAVMYLDKAVRVINTNNLETQGGAVRLFFIAFVCGKKECKGLRLTALFGTQYHINEGKKYL